MASIDLTFDSGESSLSVRRFAAREAISSLYAVSVWAVSSDPSIDLDPIVGHPASLRVTGPLGRERRWTGVVSYMEQIQAEPTGLSTYLLHLVPTLWLLGRRRDYRIFQQRSIPRIVDEVLTRWGIVPTWEVVEWEHPTLEHKVQYGESDYAFVCRLLEETGVTFTFPDGDGGSARPTLSDAPHARSAHEKRLRFVDDTSLDQDRSYVTRVRVAHEVRPGVHTVRDHDFRSPKYPLTGEGPRPASPGSVEARLEQYHYRPGAFLMVSARGDAGHDENFGDALAAHGLAADREGRRAVAFETNALDLWPGSVFSIEGHPHPTLETTRPLLVTELEIEGTPDGQWGVSGRAVLADEPYRPRQRTPRPRVHGVQSATVTGPSGQEIHTDEFGRVRVQFPWDRGGKSDDGSSCWIRPSQGWGGAGYGAIALPRVGQEVLVSFVDGNPDHPVIVGRVFNQKSPVPYKLPDHKTQSGVRSDSSSGGNGRNEILFEDSKAAELVSVQAERNLRALVKHDAVSTVGHDRDAMVTTNAFETTDHDRVQVTGGDRVETTSRNSVAFVGGDALDKVEGDRRERTEGNHLVYAARDRHLLVEKNKRELLESHSHLHVKASRNERVGGTDSVIAPSLQVKIGKKVALEAGEEIHLQASKPLVGEGASDLTLKGPGGFIRIDAGGVTIMGTLVKINEGGSAGSASKVSPAAAAAPSEAKVAPPVVNVAPRLEIADGAGTAITSTQTTVVGKKITLQVRSNPSGRTVAGISWTIPDEKVKDYTQSASTAVRTDLAAADLRGQSISFHWISGGTRNVEVNATIDGQPARATATFDVLAPTHVTLTSSTGAIAVSTDDYETGTWLHYGGVSPAVGIRWTFTATAPAGGAGQIEGTQLNLSDRTRTLNNGTVQHNATGGAWWLDTTVPYDTAVNIAAGAAATWTSNDSPGTPLTAAYSAKTIDDQFRTYFMYKPSGADSIWVTLGRLDWHWRASTTRVGAPAAAANTWTPAAGVNANANPSGAASTELPTWPDNVTSIVWT